MSALRILLLVLALAAVAFAAKYALTRGAGDAGGEARSRPAQQLDDVRERAKELEGELQRKADQANQPAQQENPN
jgi:Ni/Co efflux regulator RcnB